MKTTTKYQKLQGTAKVVIKEKFIAINTYIKKQEKSQISNLTLQCKELDKEEKTKSKTSRRKETMNSRAETSEIENRKIIEKIIKPKGQKN